MKPLFIDCSPRKGGNSDIILDTIKQNFDIDSVILRELDIKPCTGCDACMSISRCVNDDDATMLYKDIESRDEIVLIAPVYFYNFDAHTKAFIDRAQYMWSRKREKNTSRFVHIIGIGGQNFEDNFFCMEKTAKCFALTIGAKYVGGLFFRGVDKAGDIRRDDNLEKVVDFVKDIVK